MAQPESRKGGNRSDAMGLRPGGARCRGPSWILEPGTRTSVGIPANEANASMSSPVVVIHGEVGKVHGSADFT